MAIKLGVSTASFYPLETENALKEIGEYGIKTTEVFFNAPSELKDSFIDIIEDIKDSYGIEIAAIHPTMSLAESFMIFSNYQRRYYEALDQYRRYSEIAARLGAKYIILHGGKPNGILSDEEYCERYMSLKEAARKNGVTVLQENVAKYRSGDIEFLNSMIDILGDEAEFCFDIKQAIRCGYLPMEMMASLFKHIRHFHISDHSVAGDCLLPGNGKFNFTDFFETIKNLGYSGSCIIEVYENAYKNYSEINGSYTDLTNKVKSYLK